MHPLDSTGAAAACDDLRRGIDLVSGDAEVFEFAVGEMRQITDGRTVLLIGMDSGKKKSDEHGNSPKTEAMVASDSGDPAIALDHKTGLRLSERTVPSPALSQRIRFVLNLGALAP